MIKFIDVLLFVFFTVFLVFWGTEWFANDRNDKTYTIYIGFMFISHIGLVSLYLYKILKSLDGDKNT
jgi:hypothetical protein